MPGSVNRVTLVGYLGRDPEIRRTQTGEKVANLSVATSETWKDRGTGEKREHTEWHRVVVFDVKLADIAEKYLVKGGLIYLEGALKTRIWTDQKGVEHRTTEVVLGRFRSQLTMLGGGGRSEVDRGDTTPGHGGPSGAAGRQDDLDDEVPF